MVKVDVPTIHREHGFSFRVFPNNHPPAHVHAWAHGSYVIIQLPNWSEPARVLGVVGRMKDVEVKQAVRIVQDNAEIMWNGWRMFHDEEAHGC